MQKPTTQLILKSVMTSLLLSMLNMPVYAVPSAPDIVHHPIHYKPNTPHLLPTGLSPKQVSNAYGFQAITAQGKGQTIAIVGAFDDPRIEEDLAVFNQEFDLPACTTTNGCFKKIYAKNKKPKTDPGWSGEIALDVEWAHAMAPKAKIILVEAPAATLSELLHAVQVAVNNGATIVSMSWGAPELVNHIEYDSIFNNPEVTFIAATGDSGSGTLYPSTSPYVLAVGGSTLSVDSYGNYQEETAWPGSGGGRSSIEAWPDYQSRFPIPKGKGMRGVPDVAYNADPETGFSVYTSVPGDGKTGWKVVGGTSAGAPQWAALVAVANSSFKRNIGGQLNPLLYAAANPTTGNHTLYFNDIFYGTNGECGYYCTSREGYDYVTGLGSPELSNLIHIFSEKLAVE